jgi:hypothetical protein
MIPMSVSTTFAIFVNVPSRATRKTIPSNPVGPVVMPYM